MYSNREGEKLLGDFLSALTEAGMDIGYMPPAAVTIIEQYGQRIADVFTHGVESAPYQDDI